MINLTEFDKMFVNPIEKACSSGFAPISWWSTWQEDAKPAHCQRALVWTTAQYKAFIKNLLLYKDFGQVIMYQPKGDSNTYIVDGQHRFEALRQFMDNELSVEMNGVEIYWKDLERSVCKLLKAEVRGTLRLLGTDEYDNNVVETIYNSFNYTGVNHE